MRFCKFDVSATIASLQSQGYIVQFTVHLPSSLHVRNTLMNILLINKTSKDQRTVEAAARKKILWQHCAGSKIVGIVLPIEDSWEWILKHLRCSATFLFLMLELFSFCCSCSYSLNLLSLSYATCTAQKMKFSIKDLFSKCDQIC